MKHRAEILTNMNHTLRCLTRKKHNYRKVWIHLMLMWHRETKQDIPGDMQFMTTTYIKHIAPTVYCILLIQTVGFMSISTVNFQVFDFISMFHTTLSVCIKHMSMFYAALSVCIKIISMLHAAHSVPSRVHLYKTDNNISKIFSPNNSLLSSLLLLHSLCFIELTYSMGRVIIAFTRACHWTLPWAKWIQSTFRFST
jgi:hypothetical protein